MRRVPESCDEFLDRETIERAIAFDGLHFDLLLDDQSRRLPRVLAAADGLRLELESAAIDVPDRQGFSPALAELEIRCVPAGTAGR